MGFTEKCWNEIYPSDSCKNIHVQNGHALTQMEIQSAVVTSIRQSQAPSTL